nr:putative ribonuclease H-like domain-containing protein [Tanacetum cinerariifolium]
MENKPIVASSGPAWLFDIDSLTRTMNYHPVITENKLTLMQVYKTQKKLRRKELTHMCFFLYCLMWCLNKETRCDNGTEFKNTDLNQFCGLKSIKREISVLRTPQQNGIAERKNKTIIEAARTLLADSLLPIPFWAEAVNTACYKSVSPDIHSSSSGAQTRKQGDKTENKDKGKSPVVTITGFKDLNAEFKECNNNSSNGVNATCSNKETR